jgi:hypothetical protein
MGYIGGQGKEERGDGERKKVVGGKKERYSRERERDTRTTIIDREKQNRYMVKGWWRLERR